MNKNSNLIDLKNFAKRFSGILINDMEDFMNVSKKNKDAKLLAIVPKSKKPPIDKIPDWFKPYAQKIDLLMQERNQAPKWFIDFAIKQDANWEEQRKFNKLVIKRLDNIVRKNNLKE